MSHSKWHEQTCQVIAKSKRLQSCAHLFVSITVLLSKHRVRLIISVIYSEESSIQLHGISKISLFLSLCLLRFAYSACWTAPLILNSLWKDGDMLLLLNIIWKADGPPCYILIFIESHCYIQQSIWPDTILLSISSVYLSLHIYSLNRLKKTSLDVIA